MQLDVVNREGQTVRSIEVDDKVFGLTPHRSVVHQALLAQQGNQRRGTHKTKTRGEVRGSTKKLFRQKGTGRARQGGIRAPHRRGGGIVFGPRPRSYAQALPKRMRRLAIRSVLSAKAAGGEFRIIDELSMASPHTKEIRDVLLALGFDRATLIVTGQPSGPVKMSTRNLPRVKWLPAGYLNVVDLLGHRGLLMTEEAVRAAEALWGGERAGARRPQRAEAAPA